MGLKPSPSFETRPGNSHELDLADRILRKTQYLYAIVLLVVFITCAAWYSVINATKTEDNVQSTVKGPGGKPLPVTKRLTRDDGARKTGPHFGRTAKNVFRYLAAVVVFCYVGTAISMFDHAFYYEDPSKWVKEGLPWAGEWSIVSLRRFLSCFVRRPPLVG